MIITWNNPSKMKVLPEMRFIFLVENIYRVFHVTSYAANTLYNLKYSLAPLFIVHGASLELLLPFPIKIFMPYNVLPISYFIYMEI